VQSFKYQNYNTEHTHRQVGSPVCTTNFMKIQEEIIRVITWNAKTVILTNMVASDLDLWHCDPENNPNLPFYLDNMHTKLDQVPSATTCVIIQKPQWWVCMHRIDLHTIAQLSFKNLGIKIWKNQELNCMRYGRRG
jgi:hypothetical protein